MRLMTGDVLIEGRSWSIRGSKEEERRSDRDTESCRSVAKAPRDSPHLV